MVKMQISTCYSYVIFYVTNEEDNEINAVIYEFDNVTDMRNDDMSDEQKLDVVRGLNINPYYMIRYDCEYREMSIYDFSNVRGNFIFYNQEHVRSFSNMLEECYDGFVKIHEENF